MNKKSGFATRTTNDRPYSLQYVYRRGKHCSSAIYQAKNRFFLYNKKPLPYIRAEVNFRGTTLIIIILFIISLKAFNVAKTDTTTYKIFAIPTPKLHSVYSNPLRSFQPVASFL